MKLLLLGGTGDAGDMLEKLIGKSRHQPVRRRDVDDLWPDASDCDMVLVDGAAADCATIDRLLDQLRRIRNRSPRMPILVLTAVAEVALRFRMTPERTSFMPVLASELALMPSTVTRASCPTWSS